MAFDPPSRPSSPDGERDESPQPETNDRQLLSTAIQRVVNALGGVIDDVYVPGDSCYGCLKDLKRLWRLDDHDDDRTVARILWETGVFVNDLVPILLVTEPTDKVAMACADLMTAMTWPIDLVEELKELEELDEIQRTDYTVLLNSHVAYKRTIVNNPKALQAILYIVLPPLAKSAKERVPRDAQIISLVLHLLRNLAFIKSDQSDFIIALSSTNILDLILTLASNTLHNTIVLDFIHLLLRGVPPPSVLPLTTPSSASTTTNAQNKSALAKSLEAENRAHRQALRTASTRHNRFGTTVAVRQHNASFIIHKQSAIKKDPGELLDASKKATRKRMAKNDDDAFEALTYEASGIIRGFCDTFIESCFNPFLASILKDIKAERPHITEKDNLRLLFVTRWFLEYYVSTIGVITQPKESEKEEAIEQKWSYDLVAEVIDRGFVVWVLKRMRGALEEKPKLYIELRYGTETLTSLLLLIDHILSNPDAESEFVEAAETLQHQLYYQGDVLDIAFDGLKEWKEGGQMGFRSLDSSVYLSYVLLRMLERWGKNKGNVYVRKKARKKARAKKQREGEEVLDVEDERENEDQQMIHEQMFTFEKYEQKFADEDIAKALLSYLSRFKDFESSEQMKRVVGLIHRQAIKAKAEGLFFKVSTLNLFKVILGAERSFPKEQPYKDLKNVIEYIIKKFFKGAREDPFLIVEAFFPKNRGKWKAFSSWEPDPKEAKGKRGKELDPNAEVKVKRGHSWSEQLGIAIKCLVEGGKLSLVDWVKQILGIVIGQRQRIIEDTDLKKNDDDDEEEESEERVRKLDKPSNEAMAKFENYFIPYVNDEQEKAATKDPHLKLVFKLCNAHIDDPAAEELAWYIPAAILPAELSRCLTVIEQYLESPIDLGGKKAAQMLSRVKPRRQRTQKTSSDSESSAGSGSDDGEEKKKKKRNKKEAEKYKSAQFIEDSDEEFDEEAFFAKERERRELNEKRAKDGMVVGMKATGTKKRRKKAAGEDTSRKRARSSPDMDEADAIAATQSAQDSDVSEVEDATTKTRPKPRPKPTPSSPSPSPPISPSLAPSQVTSLPASPSPPAPAVNGHDDEEDDVVPSTQAFKRRGKKMIISDEEDE